MNYKLIILSFIYSSFISLSAFAQNPVLGKSARFCNPLPLEIGEGGNAAGDVSVIKEGNKYYMFCTGGGAWVSEDFVNWSHHPVPRVPVAPDIVKYNGKFYMSGNDSPLYVAENILGPYTSLGHWKNQPELPGGKSIEFDVEVFIDDDNKPYLYYSGRSTSGIYVVDLDPNDLTNIVSEPVHLFGFNNDHLWERYGDMNEYPNVAWIEGPEVFKYKDTYYLEYSASGTQWKTYAEGYYTAKSPTGPFTYAPNNPLLRRVDGLVTGTAHGSIIEGPDGHLWQFYTIVLTNPPGGRRIGMDRIVVDNDGLMSVEITDIPQWAPGVVSDPTKGNSGSLPLTMSKFRAMNALSKVSSEQPGREAPYAVDNYSGTWWEPAADDEQPTLTIDLSSATEFDITPFFIVDGIRLMFNGGGWFWGPPAPDANLYQYKIDVSKDGENFTTVLDMTNNKIKRNTIFEEVTPTECRFVRLTMTGWPKKSPLGVIEFTAFGKSSGNFLPSKEPIPNFKIHK